MCAYVQSSWQICTSLRNVRTVPRGDHATFWDLDPERAIGVNRAGQRLKLRPFMGIMGNADIATGLDWVRRI
jgi:hypothetical protein